MVAQDQPQALSLADALDAPDAPLTTQAGRQRRYCALRAEGYQVTQACMITGVTRQTVMRWRQDAEFAAREEHAIAAYLDAIRQTIDQRGRIGWDEPLTHHGRLTGDTIRKYDSSLLKALAHAHLPEYQRDDAARVQVTNVTQAVNITPELAADLQQLAHRALDAQGSPAAPERRDLPDGGGRQGRGDGDEG